MQQSVQSVRVRGFGQSLHGTSFTADSLLHESYTPQHTAYRRQETVHSPCARKPGTEKVVEGCPLKTLVSLVFEVAVGLNEAGRALGERGGGGRTAVGGEVEEDSPWPSSP